MTIKHIATIDNPYFEEYAIERAKLDFIGKNWEVMDDWSQWETSKEMKERFATFFKKIKVVDSRLNAGLVEGCYRVISVTFYMEYEREAC